MELKSETEKDVDAAKLRVGLFENEIEHDHDSERRIVSRSTT